MHVQPRPTPLLLLLAGVASGATVGISSGVDWAWVTGPQTLARPVTPITAPWLRISTARHDRQHPLALHLPPGRVGQIRPGSGLAGTVLLRQTFAVGGHFDGGFLAVAGDVVGTHLHRVGGVR